MGTGRKLRETKRGNSAGESQPGEEKPLNPQMRMKTVRKVLGRLEESLKEKKKYKGGPGKGFLGKADFLKSGGGGAR